MITKKVIIILIVVIVVSLFVYQKYFKKEEIDFELVRVTRGNVVREVSETGQVKKSEELNLGFKLSGVIEQIYIEVGEQVKEGDILAKLENSQLKIQLQEAEANLELNQAQLDKLLAGASPQDIQIAQTSVDNAQLSFQSAKQSLEDIKSQGQDNVESAYEDALNILDDSYLKIANAFNTADLIQRTYFTKSDQQSVTVKENKERIGNAKDQTKAYLDAAKANQLHPDIDEALLNMKSNLNTVSDALKIIRNTCEDPYYKNTVSSTNKSSLDTHRGYINTALTNVANTQQTISSTKITNTINGNTYQASFDTAKGQLRAAEDNLVKIMAPPRQEDIDLYQAQLNQAKAKVRLLEKKIEDTVLKSPVGGQIVRVNKSEGEIVQSALSDALLTLLPTSPFKIEVDIYEEDVVKMEVGNEVDISLVAFPNTTLEGKVAFIDPAEKMIDGVVYYEVIISFNNPPLGVKPGMTVDLIITTGLRENVLVIPGEAIKEKDGRVTVQVLKDEIFKEREIEIGLRGSDYMIEVSSGLTEGEELILR